jgi:glycopeptide antibiotics resistance protein
MAEVRGRLTAIVEGGIGAANPDAVQGGRAERLRLGGLVLQLGLIFLSSTRLAGEAAEYAFRFYGVLLGLRLSSGGLSNILAHKGVHFLLFFWLGISLYYSLGNGRLQRLAWAAVICLLIALGSEGMQLFVPGRHASVGDVVLNAASGVLATVVFWRLHPGALLDS